MTVMTGHSARRYRGNKRTFVNQYLGPFINHEMNRCITCYRCVRFYRDYAGGSDLQAFGSRGRMYFGRASDGVLESEFSGNLVEVCPTGVFTDKPFSRTYTRKWDLRSAPGVCGGCAVGCNLFVSESYGRLVRVHNRYHDELNGYFICDRGRFGLGYVNQDQRIRRVGERVEEGLFEPVGVDRGMQLLGAALKRDNVVGIGSARASLESNAALLQLVGTERFCNGLSASQADTARLALQLHAQPEIQVPSLAEVAQADAILVLGEDVSNTAPRLALAIRRATANRAFDLAREAGIPEWQAAGVKDHAQGRRSAIFKATVLDTRIDDDAAGVLRDSPDAIASAGFAIAHALSDSYPEPRSRDAASDDFVVRAAQALADAKRPVIVTGTGLGEPRLLQAAANVVRALHESGHDAKLAVTPLEANTFGVSGLVSGMHLADVLNAAARGQIDTLIVLENDLYRQADAQRVTEALAGVDQVIVIDSIDTPTATSGHLVLPSATSTESTGTFVNYEGRAQRFYAAFAVEPPVSAAWRWLSGAAATLDRSDMGWAHVDQLIGHVDNLPGLAGVAGAGPGAGYRTTANQRVPRQSHRASGRTAIHADQTVHEPKARVDEETALSYSMEGLNRDEPGALLPYAWAPGWNSNQSVFKFQREVAGPLHGGDPGVHLALDAWAADLPIRFPAEADGPAPDSADGFKLIPCYEVFGSDELSHLSDAVAERGPSPYVVFNPQDAGAMGIVAGDGVRCVELGVSFLVRIDSAMRPRYAGMVAGLAGAAVPSAAVDVHFDPDPDYRPPAVDNVIARG
jgi:NADH-quinone oxidoreductase subunit G